MPARFDHAVIGVRDLEAALLNYRRLGFDAQPGGRHEDGGTQNALIRFGLDYLELLAVYDEAAARAAGRVLFVEGDQREAALTGYALATRTLDEDVQRFRGYAAQPSRPRAMGRKRPDGQQLTWRVYAPGGSGMSFRQPWPFLIQWDTPDEQRLNIDRPGLHPNGAIAWRRVAVAVSDLAAAREIYRDQLGLRLLSEESEPAFAAQRATFVLGNSRIDLLAPPGHGPLQRILAQNGEGAYALFLSVRNLEQTRAFLQTQRIAFTSQSDGEFRLLLDPSETQGVLISFVEESDSQAF